MEVTGVILTVALLFVQTDSGFGSGSGWNYKHQSEWGGVCTSGSKQSPIDIQTKDTKKTNYGALVWENSDALLGKVTITNNGHGFSVSGASMASMILSGGGLEGRYQLAQFHFHWGSRRNGFKGSEHRIDGKQWASEMHLVHFNADFSDIKAALASGREDALAVVAVLFTPKKSRRNLKLFSSSLNVLIGSALPRVRKYGRSTVVNMAWTKLSDLLPRDLTTFFRYRGSLTTPTCNEQVIWTVLQKKLSMTPSLLNGFSKIMDKMNKPLNYIARDAMPLNGRRVEYNRNIGG